MYMCLDTQKNSMFKINTSHCLYRYAILPPLKM